MMGRCYNKNNPKYKNYGGRGVTVDERWHKLGNFIEDVDKIDGWDEEMFINGELRLDKDKKDINNKVYSLNTCTWITNAENCKFKPNAQTPTMAISPDDIEYEFLNITEFSKEHNLSSSCIHSCLSGRFNHHNGWQFYRKGDKPPKKRKRFLAIDGNGVTVIEFSQSELADRLSIPRNKVYNAFRKGRNNTYSGYTFIRK